jgi:O-antigen/teichoic acid export membrane protein
MSTRQESPTVDPPRPSVQAPTVEAPAAEPPLRSAVRPMLMRASATLMLQGFSLATGFVTTVLLAHLLGSLGYGRYTYAIAWASLLTMPAILGLDRFVIRSMAVYEVEGRWDLVKGLLRRTNALVLAAAGGIGVIASLVAVFALEAHLRWTFCLAMLLIPFGALTLLRQGAMQALGQVVWGQVPEFLVRPVALLVTVVALELAGHSLTSTTALAANVLSVAVAFAVGVAMLRRALPSVLKRVAPRYEMRAWLTASLPMMWFGAVWYGNKYIATLVVGTLAGPQAAGVYSAVERGSELIVLVLVAANMPLAPVIARMYATKDRLGLQHATERVTQAVLLVSVPIAAFFAFFPDVYLNVFGPSFKSGATALPILAVAQAVNAAAGPTGNVLIMTGHERAAFGGIAVGLVSNIVLGIVLVPSLGVTGGAIASGSSLILWNVILAVRARKQLGVNVTALPWLAVRGDDRTD